MEAYTDTVGKEWTSTGGNSVPDTIYIGGGTPSSLPLPLLDRLIAHITTTLPLREFTIEANPEDITSEWAEHIACHTAIDRVSMGDTDI